MTATTAEPVYIDLGPTPSYARRRVGWYPGRGDHDDGRVGTVRIVIQVRNRPGDSDQVDEYGVEPETDVPPPYPGARSFILENDDDPDEFGPFRVVVGTVEACGCEQGQRDARRSRQVGCKHRAALAALLRRGVIR